MFALAACLFCDVYKRTADLHVSCETWKPWKVQHEFHMICIYNRLGFNISVKEKNNWLRKIFQSQVVSVATSLVLSVYITKSRLWFCKSAFTNLESDLENIQNSIQKVSLRKKKIYMDILKENSAVTFQTPQTLDNPHSPVQNNTIALTCPSHIDSPPEGPNQFLLFSDTLPVWTCSGHQRHSSIHPGWLWLI